MEKDFLKIGGRRCRVEANWNAVAMFCRMKGVRDLSELDELSKLGVDDVLPLMHCCVKEGERLEGRDLELTADDLGSMVNTATVGEFMRVYVRQSRPDAAVVEGGGTSGGDVSKKK